MKSKQTLRVGVGGPVGSGKTALLRALCTQLREHYDIAVVTNDIYTKEDAKFSLNMVCSVLTELLALKLAAVRTPRYAKMRR